MKKSSGFTNPPFTHKTRRKDSTSFPVISRVLNGFKNRLRMQTFFGHPQKREKKNRKPSTHTKSNQAGRENQVCHIPMELPQKKKKTKQNKKWNRAVGRHWAKPAGGDARPPPGQGRGRRLPGATCPAAGADSRRGRSWLGGKHRPATWVHLGRCWNEFVSEPEYFKIEGQATTGVRGEGRKD